MNSLGLLIPVTPRNQALRAATLVLCVLVFSLGASIFSGWLWDLPTLLRMFSGPVAMKPNAALGLIVCSMTLALLVWPGTPRWARHVLTGTALAVAVTATLTLSQDILGWNLGIDQWLFQDPDTSGRSTPGRVSPPAAFCFGLMGVALATLSRPPAAPLRLPIASALGCAVIVIAALSLGGHLVNVLQGNRSWNFSPVAVDTALSFLLLGVALLLVARTEGGLSWFTDRLVLGGFVAGILGLLIAAGTAYQFARQMQSSAVLVSHSQKVLKEIEEVKSDPGGYHQHLAQLCHHR